MNETTLGLGNMTTTQHYNSFMDCLYLNNDTTDKVLVVSPSIRAP